MERTRALEIDKSDTARSRVSDALGYTRRARRRPPVRRLTDCVLRRCQGATGLRAERTDRPNSQVPFRKAHEQYEASCSKQVRMAKEETMSNMLESRSVVRERARSRTGRSNGSNRQYRPYGLNRRDGWHWRDRRYRFDGRDWRHRRDGWHRRNWCHG